MIEKKKIKRKLKNLHKGKKSCLISGELSSDNANNALMMNQDESQYDEICSFDSEINLSGNKKKMSHVRIIIFYSLFYAYKFRSNLFFLQVIELF